MNLRIPKRIFDYSITKVIDSKAKDIKLNMHVSMKIDEALGNQESTVIVVFSIRTKISLSCLQILIKDGEKDVFQVDLQKCTIQINDDRRVFKFFQIQLNGIDQIEYSLISK